MKTALLLILLSLGITFSNKDEFLFEKVTTREIKEIEKRNNSEKYKTSGKTSLSEGYYPFVNKYEIDQPISYKREDDDFMPYRVNYFFDKGSKNVKLVDYSWDKGGFIINYFELQKEMKDEYKRFDEYSKKFDDVQAQLLLKLGPPSEGNGELVKNNTEYGESWTRNVKWIKDDRTVVLNLIFTPEGWKGAIGTYRVQLRTYWE